MSDSITIRILHADGSLWHVPGKAIAYLRAECLVGSSSTGGETIEVTTQEAVEHAMENSGVLKKWVLQELDWDEIRPHAQHVGDETPPRQMETAEAVLLT